MSMEPVTDFEDVVNAALHDLENGDVTNYTMEGLMRQYRFAAGVFLGYRLAGGVNRKQWVDATVRLNDKRQLLLNTHGCWHELPSDNAWDFLKENGERNA